MKKYTVFLDSPNRDPVSDPPLWAQVKATGFAKAVGEARRLFAEDFEKTGEPLDDSEDQLSLVLVVEGWVKFKFEL